MLVHGTGGKGSGLWPTPIVGTPTAKSGGGRTEKFRKGRVPTPIEIAKYGKIFPTPDTMNHRDGKNLRKDTNIKEGGMHGVSLHHFVAMFPTPRVSDTEGGIVKNVEMKDGKFSRKNKDGVRWGVKLKDAVNHLQMFPTPRASEWKGTGPLNSKSHKYRLEKGYLDATVQEAEQITGQLNPTWVEWLMGYPLGWTDLKDSETQ